ncbi:MAG TPA: methylmalonyl Co-A mutase-associated GTPase MeaB [Steroidobacteraceae bacterium]|jgi:LAO/AO transport system kinase|nr:methylmalonyl Co-A mutase-associated GTPase MeaB [Steroidobacteraceae bacterium]
MTRGGYRPSLELVPRVLAGSRLAIARMISRAEGGYAEASEALAELYKHSGKAHIIGITGVPGAGKSTLVATLIKALTVDGHKVGVVAVDPSSPFTGGAILGDRVRMNDAAEANQAFVRSMATRGHLGGLAPATLQAVDILDAAGYSPIIIETVGVGQDEVEIVSAAHSIVVLSPPGLGDDIQAIKAGILEIADIHVVSKADKPEAAATVAALKGMLALGTARSDSTWNPPVLAVSSVSGEQMETLMATLGKHWTHLHESGEFAARQRNNCRTRIFNTARQLFQQQFEERAEELEQQLQAVVKREADPQAAAHALLGWNKETQK